MRCMRYMSLWENRKAISVGGLIFKDRFSGKASQFRSLLMTGIAVLRGNRSLEILLSEGIFLRRKYSRILRNSVNESDVIVFEGPWQYYLVRELLKNKIVIYDSHNIETILRNGNAWKSYVERLERELCNRADLIITVSDNDRKLAQKMFDIEESRLACIPEGFETNSSPWSGVNSKDLVFIGSAYLPNVQAVENIMDIAKELPDLSFRVIGNVAQAVKKKSAPPNVYFLGTVSNEIKDRILSESMLALNPIEIGSGRNLKINDYVSHGVPVLTTEIGARGFDPELRENFIVSEVANFADSIRKLSESRDKLISISSSFMNYAKRHDYKHTQESIYKAIYEIANKSK